MIATRRTALALAAAAAACPALPVLGQQTAAPAPARPPALPARLQPVKVRVKQSYAVGELVVVTGAHHLYHVIAPGVAMRYGVAVGKEGLNFRGSARIGRKAEWPSWKPTPEMIERDPKYAKYEDGMPGGPDNPLGARALYLYRNGRDTAFRIHGTNAPRSIGYSVSNGCIRMLNEHVTALYEVVPVGAKVTVY